MPDAADTPPRALWPALRRIVALAGPYRYRLAGALLLTVLGGLVWLAVPLGLRALLDAVFEAGNRALLDRLAITLLVLFVVQTALNVVGYYGLEWTGERIVADLRQRVYAHLHRLGLRFHTEGRVGELTSRLTNDVSKVQAAVTEQLARLVNQSLSLVGSAALMLVLNWRLALVVFVTVPVVSLLARHFGRIVRRLARDIQDRLADSTAIAEETLGAVRVVQSHTREPYEVARYGAAVEAVFVASRKRAWVTSLFWSSVGLLFLVALVAIFWYGGTEVLAGRLTAGDLVAFIFYALNIAQSVGVLAQLYAVYNGAAGASERLFDLLDTPPDIVSPPDAVALPTVRGSVRFEGVSFAYGAADSTRSDVLHDLTFTVEPGQTVALVGPSGAGKTTLLHLLPRFYDPTAGRVLLDGHDLRTLDLVSLRRQVGFVTQDVQLFGGTVADNLRYGRLDASDADLRAAAEAAHALGFIEALPQGFETPIGERGVKLSGGQRQRLAIARVLLADPRLLLLDEATSALDAESEALVQAAFDRLLAGRTAFVIAHRLATVRHADRILVLDGGRIVEDGTHDRLIARGGLYARLAALQFQTDPAPEPSTA